MAVGDRYLGEKQNTVAVSAVATLPTIAANGLFTAIALLHARRCTCMRACVCVCETRYHIQNFDITVCYDNRDWVLQTTTFNSEMQGAGVWIRSLQPTKTLLMSQWYQPGTLGWRTCNVGSNFCTSCSITLFLSSLARIDCPNFTVCNRAPSKVT